MKKIVLFMFLGLFVSCSNYVEFKPLYFNGDELVEMSNSFNEKQINNLIDVLDYYGEDYQLIDGKIFIHKKIDKELIWNYTTKANDSIWLLNHKVEH